MEGLVMADEKIYLSVEEQAAIRGRVSHAKIGQVHLAAVLGIRQSTLNSYLNSRKQVPSRIVAAIATILDMKDLQEAYPEDISPEDTYKRQRQVLHILTEAWVTKLQARDRLQYYNDYARLIEGTPPYGPKPISLLLRIYAGGPMLDAIFDASADGVEEGAE